MIDGESVEETGIRGGHAQFGEIGGGLRSDGGGEEERQRKKLCSAGRWHGYRSYAESEEGWERKERKTAPKEGRGTGEEEEEVEVEGEPEKDTLSQFDGTVLPGNSPSQQRIGNFTGGLSATPWKGFER